MMRGLLFLVLALGCSEHEAGTQVSVSLSSTAVTASGANSVSRAELSLGAVEILRTQQLARVKFRWSDLSPLGVAEAHETDTSSRTFAPALTLDFARDAAAELGTLSPPANRFDAIRLTLTPVDGSSVRFAGTDSEGTAYSIEVGGSQYLTLPLPAPLSLSESRREAALNVRIHPELWRAHVNLAQPTETVRRALVDAIRETTEVRSEP